jgi:hypothetical protein
VIFLTSPPKLEEKNVNFVLETVETILKTTEERRTGKKETVIHAT